MFPFSPSSQTKLTTQVHPDLIRLFTEVSKYVNTTIINGVRTLAEQQDDVARGLSKTMNSKHLPQEDGLSHAIDATPYPFDWNAPRHEQDLIYFGGVVVGIARTLGIEIRYGGDWNSNWQISDNGFMDLDHFELVIKP